MEITKSKAGDLTFLKIENDHLAVTIVPETGGKILSIYNKVLQREFLWTDENIALERQPPGSDYDSNFKGGFDELIPNDIPETIDGIEYPDHGELWTTGLSYELSFDGLRVFGTLPTSGLHYSKLVSLSNSEPVLSLSYQIRNEATTKRNFLWKLHAALKVSEGDKLISSALNGQVVDPSYSRFPLSVEPFKWPVIENTDAALVPEKNSTMDFFYLYNNTIGEMQMELRPGISRENDNLLFSFQFDRRVFPYDWYFASYGGFLDHYVTILEPCTNMPMQVTEAIAQGQSASLEPGELLETIVHIFAGLKKDYISE